LSKALSPKTFALIPYPAPNIPAIEIKGRVSRHDNILSIHYMVNGNIEDILVPALSTLARKDELWKMTCFEFFLAEPSSPEYWEFNLSPSGEWNVYHMDAYRRMGFREETSISQLPFEFKQSDNYFSLDITVDLTPILPSEPNIQLGITAIIQTKDGTEIYWALDHPGTQADFHLRESFLVNL
jgi:hypothetical protein